MSLTIDKFNSPRRRWGFKIPLPDNATHKEILFVALKLMYERYPKGYIETKSCGLDLYHTLWSNKMIGSYVFVVLACKWTRKDLDVIKFFFQWLWMTRGHFPVAFPYQEWTAAVEAFMLWKGEQINSSN